MSHLILLGDSILDNAAYVRGGPAVIDQVRGLLPAGWRATLLAVDGSRIEDVHGQLRRLPEDASHLVLSVGGNDLLTVASVLGRPAGTVGQGMLMLADIRARFADDYAGLLRALAETGRPTLVCTVYEPPFPDATLRRAAAAALGLFDDTIVRAARVTGVPVLELRAICSEDADFANPIEPSTAGGEKIARSLREVILRHDFAGRRTIIYP
jgi:GDSL-like Lipase/Acylhydrolase family